MYYPPIVFGEEWLLLIQYGSIVLFIGMGVLTLIAAIRIWDGKANPWRRILRICLQGMIIVFFSAIAFQLTLDLTLDFLLALGSYLAILAFSLIGALKLRKKLENLGLK